MKTIVLVHGAWGGAWVWQRVRAPLREAGLAVHAVTLTGCGDRAHLRTPGIDLSVHVQDVVASIEAEELRDVLLVGHSYGGIVITAAAARLQRQRPGLLAGLVYVDAQLPLPGERWSTLHDPAVQAQREAQARANDGALPPPDPSVFGLAGADHAWLLRRSVPHPFGAYHDPVDYDEAELAALPRTYVACTSPVFPTAAPHHARVRGLPGWRMVEMATGHFPMVTEPARMADVLADAAR